MANANERGDFELRWSGGPKITRKEGGKIFTMPLKLGGRSQEDVEIDTLDSFMSDVQDHGPLSGFGQHLRQIQASAGAGPDVGEKPQRGNVNYDSMGHSEEPLLQTMEYYGDEGSEDLLLQPNRRGDRTEYADEIEEDPHATFDSASQDPEDLFDRSVFEQFEDSRPRRPATLAMREEPEYNPDDSLTAAFLGTRRK